MRRPCSRDQNAVGNRLQESYKHLCGDTSIQQPPIDHLPSTIEGFWREIGRIEEDRQRQLRELNTLEDQNQILTSKMQEILRSPQQAYSANGKVVNKVSLAPKIMTTNLSNQTLKVPIDYSELYTSSTEDSKIWATPLSSQISQEKQPTYKEDMVSNSLITTLKKPKWQHRDYQDIICKMVAVLFFETDEDASGSIDEEEFLKMIDELPFEESLREKLRGQFKYIDVDKSGDISLTEFLYFVLQYKPSSTELQENGFNEPYDCRQNLSFWAQTRLWVFKVITTPNFNIFSKVLFCLDLCMTLVPIITLFISVLRPTSVNELLWDDENYFYIISVFFAAEWVFGLILCNKRTEFLKSGYHILELLSFLPWIIYKSAGYTGENITLKGFVLCRILRVFKLSQILPSAFSSLKEQLDIYENTLTLAFMSYKGMAVFMLFINVFLATLIFAFERGKYDENLEVWIRVGEFSESPFSNFLNCCYFIVVTGTTLGYGDMSPTSYVGKLIAMSTVAIGLVNITFFIKTIGNCFEEVSRIYLNGRTRESEVERSAYIRQNLYEAKKKVEELHSKRSSTYHMSKISKRNTDRTVV